MFLCRCGFIFAFLVCVCYNCTGFLIFEKEKVGWVEEGEDREWLGGEEKYDQNIF